MTVVDVLYPDTMLPICLVSFGHGCGDTVRHIEDFMLSAGEKRYVLADVRDTLSDKAGRVRQGEDGTFRQTQQAIYANENFGKVECSLLRCRRIIRLVINIYENYLWGGDQRSCGSSKFAPIPIIVLRF